MGGHIGGISPLSRTHRTHKFMKNPVDDSQKYLFDEVTTDVHAGSKFMFEVVECPSFFCVVVSIFPSG